MNRILVIAGSIGLLGIIVVGLFLFRERQPGVDVEKPHRTAPSRTDGYRQADEPGLDREPVESEPAHDHDRDEPDQPDCIGARTPGWWIWGFVREPDKTPIAGAKVALKLYCESFYREFDLPLNPVRTDEKGRYAVRFENPFGPPALAPSGSIPFTVQGRAIAGGFVQSHWNEDDFLLDTSLEHFSFRFDFVHVRGGILHGFVVDSSGAPVRGAEVLLCDPATGRELRWAETDLNGEYSIDIRINGREDTNPPPADSMILAAKLGGGISHSAAVTIVPDADTEAPLLTLHECGVIAGRVQRPDGSPIEGVEILAFPQEWTLESKNGLGSYSTGFPGQRKARFDLATIGSGHIFGLTKTGPDGLFRMAGLRPGAYMLEISWEYQCAETEDDDVDSLLIPCTTGNTAMRIVLCNYELRVLLVDEQGRRIPRAKLYCVSGPNESKEGSAAVGGEAVLMIAPGPLRLQATAGDGLLARHETTVQVGAYWTEVRLELQKESLGRINLVVTYHDGRRVKSGTPLRILARSANDFICLDEQQICCDDKGRALLELVPDRYKITIGEDYFLWGPDPDMSRPVRIENVIVEKDAEIELPVTLKPAGRLRLTLHCKEPVPQPWIKSVDSYYADSEDDRSHWFRYFNHAGDEGAISWYRLKPETAYLTHERIVPGNYRLEVEAAGFETASAYYTIRADTVTDVEVWFSAR